MLDRQYQSDPHYLSSHYSERRRAAGMDLQARQTGSPGMRERLLQSLGDVLIAWGQRLKQASEPPFKELCQDCP